MWESQELKAVIEDRQISESLENTWGANGDYKVESEQILVV